MKFRPKEIIEAEQFLPPWDNVPKGVTQVHKNRAGFWVGSIRNTQGTIMTIRYSDWVLYPVDAPDGRYVVLTDERFKAKYEAVDEVFPYVKFDEKLTK